MIRAFFFHVERGFIALHMEEGVRYSFFHVEREAALHMEEMNNRRTEADNLRTNFYRMGTTSFGLLAPPRRSVSDFSSRTIILPTHVRTPGPLHLSRPSGRHESHNKERIVAPGQLGDNNERTDCPISPGQDWGKGRDEKHLHLPTMLILQEPLGTEQNPPTLSIAVYADLPIRPEPPVKSKNRRRKSDILLFDKSELQLVRP